MTLPELLKNQRIKLGLTLDDVAEAIGSSKSYIHEMEKGKSEFSFRKAVMLSVTLNLPINIMAAHLIASSTSED